MRPVGGHFTPSASANLELCFQPEPLRTSFFIARCFGPLSVVSDRPTSRPAAARGSPRAKPHPVPHRRPRTRPTRHRRISPPPPQHALPTRRTTLPSPTTPAGHPCQPRPAQTRSTTLSTTTLGSRAPSQNAASSRDASTTSATFSTLRSYARTCSMTPSANTI